MAKHRVSWYGSPILIIAAHGGGTVTTSQMYEQIEALRMFTEDDLKPDPNQGSQPAWMHQLRNCQQSLKAQKQLAPDGSGWKITPQGVAHLKKLLLQRDDHCLETLHAWGWTLDQVLSDLAALEGSGGENIAPPRSETTSSRFWLFQSNPKVYNFSQELRTYKVGDVDDWSVSRYRDEMKPGDHVVIWQAGADAGVYALGEIIGPEPIFKRPAPDWKRAQDPDADSDWAVRFRYTHILTTSIPKDVLAQHPVLGNMQVLRAPQGTNFRVTPEEWASLQDLLVSAPPIPPPDGPQIADPRHRPNPYTPTPITFDDLVSTTLWDRDVLQALCDAIESDSPQLILAGPPGTGKTWVARKVAEYLTQESGRLFRKVQFHPSYTYEEFIQGLRPVAQANGTIAFQVVDGVVPRMTQEIGTTAGPHILLIDEINRANLPKVLGELMYLFEYRDETIDLQIARNFSLPQSLRFIGTMNTADRSIRSLDTALRRRFDIIECPPDPAILERYYATHATEIDLPHLLEGFNKLNDRLTDLRDRHHTIGHTFFMRAPLTKPYLERVWNQKIAPLLEEYFFDQPDIAASFTLEKFWPNA